MTGSNEPTVGRTEPARTTTPTLVAAPQISMVLADRGPEVSPIAPAVVQAAHATLVQVSLRNPEGKLVKGLFSADRSRWLSAEPLGYGRTYTVQAKAQDPGGRSTAHHQVLHDSATPPDDRSVVPLTVGCHHVRGRPAGRGDLRSAARGPGGGRAGSAGLLSRRRSGWYWWDDRTVYWWPRQYWRPGTRAIVQANIYGMDLGNGE